MATVQLPHTHGDPEPENLFPATTRQRPSVKRRILWTLRTLATLLVFLLFFGYIGASLYMAENIGDAPRTVPQVQASIGSHYEDVQFQPHVDHFIMPGWLFHSSAPNKDHKAVILVNGWKAVRDNPLTVALAHDLLLDSHGFDVLLFDTRGTGGATGGRATLGNLESRDIEGAVDFMVTRGYPQKRLAIVGNSAGGAAAIMASADLPNVGAIEADNSFAIVRPLLDDGWHNATYLPGSSDWLALQFGKALDINASLAPVDVVKGHPERAYLFFHAAQDTFITVDHANALRAASANQASRLILIKTSLHAGSYLADPVAYRAALIPFLLSQFAAHGG